MSVKSLEEGKLTYQKIYVVLSVKKGSKTMVELNEQELEQVAGGTFHYGSHSSSDGGSTAVRYCWRIALSQAAARSLAEAISWAKRETGVEAGFSPASHWAARRTFMAVAVKNA